MFRISVSILTILMFWSPAMSAEGDDYFPLRSGTIWTYGGSPLEMARIVFLGVAQETEEGVIYAWDGLAGKRLVKKDAGEKVYHLVKNSWELLFDLSAEKGATWTINGEDGDLLAGSVATVDSVDEVVRLPFGVVEESIHLSVRPSPGLADAGLLEVWFGPDLGVIKWVEQTFAGPQTYELASMAGTTSGSGEPQDSTVVNPPGIMDPDTTVVLPPPVDQDPTPMEGFPNSHAISHGDLLAELATDREVYAPGDSVKVKYKLTNRGEPVKLMYRSGQEYDAILEGQSGLVWRWSDGQMFIQVLQSQELAEGESTEFTFEFVLEEEWVRPNDSFLLTAFLAVSPDEEGALDRSRTEGMVKIAIERQSDGSDPVSPPLGRVQAEMKIDRNAYSFEDSIVVSYLLTNVSDSSLVLFFPSGQRYDLYIDDSEGRVWTWSALIDFDQSIMEQGLPPGETYSFTELIPVANTGLRENGVYVLAGFLAVAVSDSTNISWSETEVLREFVVNQEGDVDGEWPPGPPPDPLPGSPLDRGLRVGMALDVQSDSVAVVYRMMNTGDEPLQMVYRSGQKFDLVLDGPAGELWRWSTGRGFDDALWEETLAPGDSLVVHEKFPKSILGYLEGGSYVLSAYATVTPDVQGALARSETEARIKFSVQSEGVLNLEDLKAGSGDDKGGGMSADFNTDGLVSFSDFVLFASSFGSSLGSIGYVSSFDLDSDGIVGFSDFILFAKAFNG